MLSFMGNSLIVWQDRRTAKFCDELKDTGHTDMIKKKTGLKKIGLLLNAYFSATKLKRV
jgi:glycerol kinase